MLAYFARWIVGGVATFFVVGLMLHTLVMYTPGGGKDKSRDYMSSGDIVSPHEFVRLYAYLYNLDKPWPVSYLTYLFDPIEPKTLPFWQNIMIRGTDIPISNIYRRGNGVLTGDLGYSYDVECCEKVTDVFGQGFGEFMLLVGLTLPLSMAFVAVQRRRRPLAFGPPNYPKSRNLLYRYQHPMRVLGL
jgi:hypothetical protein